MTLSISETRRYSRHLILKGFGAAGQKKLKQSKVLVVGAGGLGSPAIAYLAAAGVGQISIIDHDMLEISNLQRQIIHATSDLGVNKAKSAAQFAKNLNPEIEVQIFEHKLNDENAGKIIGEHDIIVDGTDRFSTRLMIANACEQKQRILVSGAVSMFDGQVSVFAPFLLDAKGKPAPKFSCLYPQIPDDDDLPGCEVNGIIGATTGIIGTLMAMEVIKIISGEGEPLIGRLLLYDGRAARFNELKYQRE